MDRWLTNKKATRRYATWLYYDWLVKRYINPDLGTIKLKEIRSDHIQRVINKHMKSGTGIYTVRKVRDVLHCTLEQAVWQEVLIRNPADLVNPPPKPHN